MSDEDDLRLAETLANDVDELVEIGKKLRDGHGRCRNALVERPACTALIPVDDGEALLECGVEDAEEWRVRKPGAAVQKDECRILEVAPTNHHTLIHAAYGSIAGFGNPASRRR